MAIDWSRMSQKDIEAMQAKPKPSKYRAKRTEYKGVMYDSKAEAEHAILLDRLPSIAWWLRQV